MIEKIIVNSRTTEIHGTTRTINTSFQQSGLTEDTTLAEIFTRLVTENNEMGVAIINDDLVPFLRYGERLQAATYGTFAATVAQLIADNNEQVKRR